MKNLPGGQLPPVLWRWLVGLLSPEKDFLHCTSLIVADRDEETTGSAVEGLRAAGHKAIRYLIWSFANLSLLRVVVFD